jgi:hypothetical protein
VANSSRVTLNNLRILGLTVGGWHATVQPRQEAACRIPFDENLAKKEDLAKKLRDKHDFYDYAMRRGSWDSSNWETQ